MNEKVGRTAVSSEAAGGVERFWNHLDEESRHKLLDAEEQATDELGTIRHRAAKFLRKNPQAAWTGAAVIAAAVAVIAYWMLRSPAIESPDE